VARTLNNIGSVYDSLGNYHKALEHYERCLKIKSKIKGNESIDVATLLNNIGVVC
jgi:adenylate cyclase